MSVMRCESCEKIVDTDYYMGIYVNAPELRGYYYFFCDPDCADGWLEQQEYEPLPEDFDDSDIHNAKPKTGGN